MKFEKMNVVQTFKDGILSFHVVFQKSFYGISRAVISIPIDAISETLKCDGKKLQSNIAANKSEYILITNNVK